MSRVDIIYQMPIAENGKLDKDQYTKLLEAYFSSVSGSDAWPRFIGDDLRRKVVGLKTNCLTKKLLSTPTALVAALADILINYGLKDNNLIIWERTIRELRNAGFIPNASSRRIRCLGTDANGVGYSSQFYSFGKVNSLVSRVLTDLVDFNINIPVLKDHSIAGLSASLKNMYGAINNPNKYHDNDCNPFAAEINNLAPIRDKNRLTIIDATRVQYNGGPGFDSRYLSHEGCLIISTDPVAADYVGLNIIEQLRTMNKLPDLKRADRPADYLETAVKLGLGSRDFVVKAYTSDGQPVKFEMN